MYRVLVVFSFRSVFVKKILIFGSSMSSSGSPMEDSSADILNPYMYELKIHPKELILKDGKVQMKEVQGPKGEGSLEDRMEALEQEVFSYKKMVEREVDVIHKISLELIT